jgi:IMP dehydrogenase
VGTTLEQAKDLLHKNRIEKLLVVDRNQRLRGLITIKDIEKVANTPIPARIPWAGCGWAAPSAWVRTDEANVSRPCCSPGGLFVVDSAHGHTKTS